MEDISKITGGLECDDRGIWFAKRRPKISYPEDGNVRCRKIEESSFWFKHRNKCIVEAIRLYRPDGAIFDVGGGNGYVCSAIKNLGIETVLVEPGIQGVMNAHARGLSPIICATLEDARFKAHTIAAVGLFDILEHIEDDIGFLKTINTILIPDGRLYITVPAYNFLFSVDDRNAKHYRRYTITSLTEKLKSAGFIIDFKTYIFRLLPIPIFFLRTIPGVLRLRKKRELRRIQKEHSQPANWLGRLLNVALDTEIKALKSKKPISFGGSCLVVATVLKNRG